MLEYVKPVLPNPEVSKPIEYIIFKDGSRLETTNKQPFQIFHSFYDFFNVCSFQNAVLLITSKEVIHIKDSSFKFNPYEILLVKYA